MLKKLLHNMQGCPHAPPPPMFEKWAQVGKKILVSWLKIVGTFSNFAIKFHNFAKN